MKFNGRMVLFTLMLAILTTACKFFFGPNLDFSGVSPVFAIALFAGMMIPQRNISFVLPLLAIFLSDVAIQLLYVAGKFPYPGFYSGMALNYIILLSATLIGWMLKGRNMGTVLAGAIIAPTVFFLLSNFSVWAGSDGVYYTKDLNGLMTSYINGLPFYRNAILATLVFLPVILLGYNVITRNRTQLTLA